MQTCRYADMQICRYSLTVSRFTVSIISSLTGRVWCVLNWGDLGNARYPFSYSTGKSVGETEKLWGSLNETKEDIREIQAKKNKVVAGGNTSVDSDNTSGNPVSFFNSTNKRLERLENESRNLIEDFNIIEKAAKNISRTELKVRARKN